MARPGEIQYTGPPTRAVLQAQGPKSQVLPQRTLTCPAPSGTGARRGAIGALTLHLAPRAAAWLQAAPRDVAPWDTPARCCGGTPQPPIKAGRLLWVRKGFFCNFGSRSSEVQLPPPALCPVGIRAFSFVSEFQNRVRSLFTVG